MLTDKVVLITGAAHGIGRATANACAEEGAHVIVGDVDSDAGRAVVEEIEDEGGTAQFEALDVSRPASVEEVLDGLMKTVGTIDVLVNNAGVLNDARLVNMSVDQWEQVVDVNLKGPFLCGRTVAQAMVEGGKGGVILNTASVAGVYGNFGQSNYVAAKAGLIGMTRTWARELGQEGIRVNAVAPGFIETGILDDVPNEVIEGVTDRTPLGRLGTPREIADAFVFLASDRASFIHGEVLSVDGGIVL